MGLPPVWRYRVARLRAAGRSLNRPALWGGLGVLGLLAVAIPQYLRHPEWLRRYEAEVDSAVDDGGTDLGTLSNEDLADLAEIDNLALLLNQLQPTTAAALEVPAADPSRLALPEAAAPADGPFAQYLERSRFPFSPAPREGDVPAPGPEAEATNLRSPSSTPAPSAANRVAEHPLETALRERLGQVTATDPAAASPSAPADPASESPSPPWLVEGRLPGTGQRFIRTTPQMSPPPGTTGYATPPRPEPQPAPPVPGAAPLDLNLGAPPAAGSAVTPGAAPVTPTAPPPGVTPQAPPPFSAPRPPGVYTGNGYINTFADPSGPPN